MNERGQNDSPPAASRLLSRHLSGDHTAFGELVMLFRARVYSYLVRSGVAEATRDDLFQEIFLKVHSAASSHDKQRPVEPWLFTIVANTVRSHFRSQSTRAKFIDGTEAPEIAVESAASELAEARETKVWLDEAVKKLPEAQREAVILCCIEQLAQQDVAKILGIPLNTLKTNLSRGRAALAKALVKRNAAQSREVRA